MHELHPHVLVVPALPPGLPPAPAPQCRRRRLSCPLERPSPGGIQRRPWLHLSPPSRLPKPSAPDLPCPRRPTLAGSGWSFPTSAMGKRSGRRGLGFFWRIGCVCGGGTPLYIPSAILVPKKPKALRQREDLLGPAHLFTSSCARTKMAQCTVMAGSVHAHKRLAHEIDVFFLSNLIQRFKVK